MSSFAGIAKITLATAALLGFAAYHHLPCCAFKCHTPKSPAESAKADWKLVANCVEVRSASVFAGACHYNGELMTAGNEALFAIEVESGTSQGVDLGGVSAAALVGGDKNLKLGGERKSIVYVSEGASAAQRDAVVALLGERSHGELGRIQLIESKPLVVRAKGESFEVTVGDQIALKGVRMPDRACCKQPNQVWYEPLVPLRERVVGFTQEWRVNEPRLGLEFTRTEENSAFLGRLSMFDGSCAGGPCTPAAPTN